MFSGKTTELIRQLQRYNSIGHHCICITSTKDTRNNNKSIKTHTGKEFTSQKVPFLIKLPQGYITIPYEQSLPYLHYNANVVGIDEGQFFDDIVEFVNEMLNKKYHIIVAGLVGDYKQKKFGYLSELIPLADTITFKTALCVQCKDGTAAPFTKRKNITHDVQELVGGKDLYEAVCRKHLNNKY